MNARRPTVQSEATSCGEQILIAGVHPVTMRERLMLQIQAPLAPLKAQKPLIIGLFDEDGRRQLNLF